MSASTTESADSTSSASASTSTIAPTPEPVSPLPDIPGECSTWATPRLPRRRLSAGHTGSPGGCVARPGDGGCTGGPSTVPRSATRPPSASNRERVRPVLRYDTMMVVHPMQLHGYTFAPANSDGPQAHAARSEVGGTRPARTDRVLRHARRFWPPPCSSITTLPSSGPSTSPTMLRPDAPRYSKVCIGPRWPQSSRHVKLPAHASSTGR